MFARFAAYRFGLCLGQGGPPSDMVRLRMDASQAPNLSRFCDDVDMAVPLFGLLYRLLNLNSNPVTQPKCPTATGAFAEGPKSMERCQPFVVQVSVPSAKAISSLGGQYCYRLGPFGSNRHCDFCVFAHQHS